MSSCPSSEGFEFGNSDHSNHTNLTLKQGSTGFLVASCFAWSSLKSVAEVHETGQRLHRAARRQCHNICLYLISSFLFPHWLTVQKSHEIKARWFMVVKYVSCLERSSLASAFLSAFTLGASKDQTDQILSGRVPTVRATSETTAAQLKKNAEVTGTSLRVDLGIFYLRILRCQDLWHLTLSQLLASIGTFRCLTDFIPWPTIRRWAQKTSGPRRRLWLHRCPRQCLGGCAMQCSIVASSRHLFSFLHCLGMIDQSVDHCFQGLKPPTLAHPLQNVSLGGTPTSTYTDHSPPWPRATANICEWASSFYKFVFFALPFCREKIQETLT